MSVKPRDRRNLLGFPVADIRIDIITTRSAVTPERVEVECTATSARGKVLVIVPPRVFHQLLHIAFRTPVLGIGRASNERLEALVGGRVTEIVQAVQIERGFEGADVLPGLHYTRLVDLAEHLRCHQRREDTDDDHDHQDFDEGKTARVTRGGAAAE